MNEESCPRIEGLSALVDGELDAPQRAALEAHAAGCAVCAPVLARMQGLHARFASLPEPRASFDLAAEVDRRIGALAPTRPVRASRPSRSRWWQAAVLAPGGALAIAAGLWLGASMLPAAGGAVATQMAAFSPLPPGSLCLASSGCARVLP